MTKVVRVSRGDVVAAARDSVATLRSFDVLKLGARAGRRRYELAGILAAIKPRQCVYVELQADMEKEDAVEAARHLPYGALLSFSPEMPAAIIAAATAALPNHSLVSVSASLSSEQIARACASVYNCTAIFVDDTLSSEQAAVVARSLPAQRDAMIRFSGSVPVEVVKALVPTLQPGVFLYLNSSWKPSDVEAVSRCAQPGTVIYLPSSARLDQVESLRLPSDAIVRLQSVVSDEIFESLSKRAAVGGVKLRFSVEYDAETIARLMNKTEIELRTAGGSASQRLIVASNRFDCGVRVVSGEVQVLPSASLSRALPLFMALSKAMSRESASLTLRMVSVNRSVTGGAFHYSIACSRDSTCNIRAVGSMLLEDAKALHDSARSLKKAGFTVKITADGAALEAIKKVRAKHKQLARKKKAAKKRAGALQAAARAWLHNSEPSEDAVMDGADAAAAPAPQSHRK